LASAGAVGLIAPNSLQMLEKLFGPKDKKSNRHPALMKYKKLVEVEETEAGIIIKITDKGKRRVAFTDIEDLKIKTPLSWDKKWRMVMFDIPESKREDRRYFAEKLSEFGLLMIQKSCWIHPFECLEEVGYLTDILDLDQHVSLVVIEESNFNDFAIRHFKKVGVLG